MQEKKLSIKISPTILALYLLALTFVLDMRTVWTAIPKYGRFGDITTLMLLTGAAGYILFRKNYKRHFLNGVITTAALCAYLFIYYFFDEYKLGNFPRVILRICVICLLCFAMREEHKKKLFEIMETIIIIIAVVSLAFWLAGSVAGVIHPNGIEYTTWSKDGSEVPINKYYHLYFETQVQDFFGFKVIRNSAIFNESPMSSFMFCFAMLVELFKKPKTDYKIVIFLAVCVATTFSTQGYVIVILALFIKYMFSKTHSSIAAVMRVAAVPVLLVILVIVADNLIQAKMDTSSGAARFDDFAAGFKAWMDHPIMGNGYNNTMSYTQYMSTYRMKNTGFSNSLMQLLAFGGIYLFVPYVGSIAYGIFKIVRKRDWNELAFVSLFVVLFVFTITTFQMLSLYTFFVLL
jgi:hypothetical protein